MIKKIKFYNDSILGNLELDFTKPDGNPYNTIIIAGENGTGKTSIFNKLAEFLSSGSFEPFENIIYTDKNNNDCKMLRSKTVGDNIEGEPFLIEQTKKKAIYKAVNEDNIIKNNDADIRNYGCIYSRAKTGFHAERITSVTTEQLDQSNVDIDSSDDYTSIKQLLIDIDTIDNSLWRNISRNPANKVTIKQFDKSCGLSRFKNAFNNFFDTIKFDYIDNENKQEKNIFFLKNKKKISIDNLSSGEKQIIFRGTQLLKNNNVINNGIILIDEPELSLHPKWQLKILNYYRNLFSIPKGKQTAQIIIATHSNFIIKSAVTDPNVLILVISENSKNKTCTKVVPSSFVLNPTTSDEINYEAFGIDSAEYHIQLYGKLQNDNSLTEIKATDTFIQSHPKYDSSKYEKINDFTNPRNGHVTRYFTLPSFVRNSIDHPSPTNTYTPEELHKSIVFLRDLLTP